MDNSDKDKLIDEKLDHQADAIEVEVGDVVAENHGAVEKKSGGGFSLLLSLLALCGTAYLYYLNWNQSTIDESKINPDVIKTLQDRDKILGADLSNAQVDLATLTEQISVLQTAMKKQLTQVQSQADGEVLNTATQVEAFDNSENEQSIDDLTTQLNQQAQTIAQLQSQIQNQLTAIQSQVPAQERLPEGDDLRASRLAVAELNKILLLLDTQRLPLAIQSLDAFLSVTEIKPMYKRQLGQLSQELKGVAVPDIDGLKQQLRSLQVAVDELALNTTAEPKAEDSWYSQLITVKKIASDEVINSTATLLEFKAELKQNLFQASLFLTYNDQLGWTNSLNEAVNLMTEQMPSQKKMMQQLEQLSTQAVAIELPNQIDIQSLIDELKGLR